MMARLQRLLVLAWIALLSTAIASLVSSRAPAWAWVLLVVLLAGHALSLGIGFLVLASVQEGAPTSAPGVSQLVRAWWGETLRAPRVFGWQQPFRSNAQPDRVPPKRDARAGVILVHGFFCNRGIWNPWMIRLRAEGVPFIAVNLEPVFGSIGAYARVIEAAVRRMEQATGCAPVLVAHSMGGLAVRAWLDEFDALARVRRVITIGTPHQGTWLGRFAHTDNTREMALRSNWLVQLQQREAKRVSRPYARFTCFYGNCDHIVFPASAAMLPGADNRHLSATAHVEMAFRDEVFDELRSWLEIPSRAAASAPASGDPAAKR